MGTFFWVRIFLFYFLKKAMPGGPVYLKLIYQFALPNLNWSPAKKFLSVFLKGKGPSMLNSPKELGEGRWMQSEYRIDFLNNHSLKLPLKTQI